MQLRNTGTFVMEIWDAGFYSYRWPRWGLLKQWYIMIMYRGIPVVHALNLIFRSLFLRLGVWGSEYTFPSMVVKSGLSIV